MNELTPPDATRTLHDELRWMIVQCQKRVTAVVNAELTQLYWALGRGFESKNLRRMIQFAETFPNIQIVVTLSRQLSWSYVVAILPIKNQDTLE